MIQIDDRPCVGDRVQSVGLYASQAGTVVRRPEGVTYVIVEWDSGWEQAVSSFTSQGGGLRAAALPSATR